MEHVSHKDKQKEEVCLEKRRDQPQLLVVSQPIPWWKCFFPVLCMIFFLLSGENCTKKCYDPELGNSVDVCIRPNRNAIKGGHSKRFVGVLASLSRF
jgi:hypothetical protein